MSSLIKETFERLSSQQKKAIIPFLTAGFPNRTQFLQLLHELPRHGANIIEIGIPFSDPMADGIVIQKASEQAIKEGFNLRQCLGDIAIFKKKYPMVPIVIMTYANPLIQYGMDDFLLQATKSCVDGLLLVDVPPEHHSNIIKSSTPLNMIRLITPTTHADRLSVIQANASGFVYYVSVKGTTGSQVPDQDVINTHLSLIKHRINLPMVIGFGISNAHIAKQMAQISDGIVIGSSLIKPFIDAHIDDYETISHNQLNFLSDIYQHVNHE